jgi:predicted ribosome quality control (RQC) complex YloA/Tae2 family protein
MQVDFLTLACLHDYLDSLLGARVQGVLLPDERSLALELYAGRRLQLLASAESQAPRMLLVPEAPRRGVGAETPLLLLLRKWVRGARLVDVTQPPWERVLIMHFSGRAGDCQLVVELMGRYSNIILVGPEGTVLEAVKHVGPKMSRTRTTLPGHPYQLPAQPPNRRPPLGLNLFEWTHKLAQADGDEVLHRWLMGRFLGISKVLGQEIAARATGDPAALVGAAEPQALFAAFLELFAPLENGWWQPHVALDEAGAVMAFTPYEAKQFARVEPVKDISEAMWRFFEARGLADPYAGARQAVQALIDEAGARLKRRLKRMQGQTVDEQDVQDLRVAGELLLTYQGQVARGAQEVTVTDYEGELRVIVLDPQMTAVENAQAYFQRYDKARRGGEQIPALLKELQTEQAYLEQLEADLMLAESRPEIDAVREALSAAGWAPQRRRRTSGQVRGPRRFEVEGFAIFVGRNARQNEQVTFERGGPEDLWLHVRGLPGAHVVIKRGRQTVPEAVIQRAAELAAYYSRARHSETQVSVDVVERRFVRRMRGKYPGLVTYRNERTLWVKVVGMREPGGGEAAIRDAGIRRSGRRGFGRR